MSKTARRKDLLWEKRRKELPITRSQTTRWLRSCPIVNHCLRTRETVGDDQCPMPLSVRDLCQRKVVMAPTPHHLRDTMATSSLLGIKYAAQDGLKMSALKMAVFFSKLDTIWENQSQVLAKHASSRLSPSYINICYTHSQNNSVVLMGDRTSQFHGISGTYRVS